MQAIPMVLKEYVLTIGSAYQKYESHTLNVTICIWWLQIGQNYRVGTHSCLISSIKVSIKWVILFSGTNLKSDSNDIVFLNIFVCSLTS